jgi:hypothetical protein
MLEIKKTSDSTFQYANILIFGESGSGKTHFLGTAPDNEMIIFNIASESGLLTLRGKNIDVITIHNMNEMEEALKWLETEGVTKYKYVGIDSFSQFQKNLEKQLPKTKDGFELWRTIKDLTKSVIDRIKVMPINLVAICEISLKDDEGAVKFVPSLLGSSKDDIAYWFDEVYFFEKTGKAGDIPMYRALTNSGSKYPCKSRIGTLPVVMHNPTIVQVIETLKPLMQIQEQVKVAEESRAIDTVAQIKMLAIAKKVMLGTILMNYSVKSLDEMTEIQRLDCIDRLEKK